MNAPASIRKQVETLPIGLFFDGALGYEHNGQRVIELAKQYGWIDEFPAAPEDEDEFFHETVEDATTFLEGIAPEGHYVAWNDGDFGVWPNDIED